MASPIAYLAWGRPQRPRANLIQTLHTVEALAETWGAVTLYLPPVPRRFDMDAFLRGMGIRHAIDLHPTALLHRRWGGWPFVLMNDRNLRRAAAIYTRVPELSVVLARAHLPHFLEIHDTATLAARQGLPKLLQAMHDGWLKGIVAISSAGREALVDAGFPCDQIHVVPSGVDIASFEGIPALTKTEVGAGISTYVGRISHDRGLPILEAIAAAGIPVHLTGPVDDPPRTDLGTLTTHPGVAHADVPAQVAAGAFALMPYQPDLQHAASISPIKLFEAMAAGRVVLATDLPALREIIRSGENGVLLPADDPQAWIRTLRHLQTHPDAALTMAARARQDARAYSWSRRAEHLVDILATKAP
ncbi:MAG: glycosyltransferase family 4 protein [Zoogloeaceae bacterium]|nr:glycosyltransferase family 4 protein [Zoogloeaceae bacterium]